MPTNNFVFNGVSASDYGVKVLERREERHTSRSGEGIAVPGRTGELFADDGRYENVNVIYSCAFVANAYDQMKAFNTKLLSMVGNYELSDDFDLDVDHMVGRYAGGIEPKITRHGDKARVDFTFNCSPKKYLSSGAVPVEFGVTSTGTAAEYHAFSEFSAAEKYALKNLICGATSYKSDEVEDIKYFVIQPTVTSTSTIRFEVDDGTEFFAILQNTGSYTPYNIGQVIAGRTRCYTAKQFSVFDRLATTTPYLIFPRSAISRVYVDDALIFEDEIFEEFSITNPTLFAANPILRIGPLSSDTFDDYICAVNGVSVQFIHDEAEGSDVVNYLTIDTETMNAYSLAADNENGYLMNCNKYVTISDYNIGLSPGENAVLVSSLADTLEIIPRWWTL